MKENTHNVNLLFVEEKFSKGGRQRRVLELIKKLEKEEDIRVSIVLTNRNIAFSELKNLNLDLIFLENLGNFRLLIAYFNLLCRNNYDIVQTWTLKTSFFFTILKPFFNYGLVSSYIANTFGFRNVYDMATGKIVHFFSDTIVSNSKAGLEIYGVPSIKGKVVYNSYDLNRLNRIDLNINKNHLGIKTRFMVVMVARLSVHKDFDTFLKVGKRICEKRNDVSFVSIGDGPLFNNIKKKVDKSLADRILFLGEFENVESIISLSDIGVLFSYSEGISNSIIEYMMLKKPVIATGIGGTSEIVSHNKNGFHYIDPNINEITEKVLELIENEKYRNQIGSRGFDYAVSKFNQDTTINKYLDIYKNLIK